MSVKGETPALKRAGEKLLASRMHELEKGYTTGPLPWTPNPNQLNLFTDENLRNTLDLQGQQTTPKTADRDQKPKTDHDRTK